MPKSLSPEDRRRIDEQQRLLELARPLVPGAAVPYFGHMRLHTSGRVTDLLLGLESRAGRGVAILDWRRAPLAEAFFACDEGEEYEIETPERTLTGTLLERSLLGFAGGELVEIARPDGLLTRQGDGEWRRAAAREGVRLQARPQELRGRGSPIDVELDAAQRRAVELPAGTALLVLGEAGCGKTTVALHRLAHLLRRAGRGARAAVVVPTDGLRRLVESLVERLEIAPEVWLYDRWAGELARRAFGDIPAEESAEGSAGVVRIKRHPGVRSLLAELARQPPALADEEDGPVRRTRALATRADLQALFGDSALLDRLCEDDPTLTRRMVAEVLEHTRVQFSQTAEEEWAHVDADRLVTLDGRLLDAGTPMEDARTIDPEDYAVLFELDRLRAGLRGAKVAKVTQYDLLVLDEAQELAPLELALLGRALRPGGTLVVAGDAEQQVDPTSAFGGWPATMADLGHPGHQTATLDIGYRCPPSVTALARHVLDPIRPAGEADAAIVRRAFDSELHQVAWLVDELRRLQDEDPAIPVALICRTPEAARRLAGLLRHGVGVRLALEGDFDLVAGINVTCVQEVKGLEFDTVVVPDAAGSVYPDTPQARRALYVAVTRATRQLVLGTVGDWSPLLSDGAATARPGTVREAAETPQFHG